MSALLLLFELARPVFDDMECMYYVWELTKASPTMDVVLMVEEEEEEDKKRLPLPSAVRRRRLFAARKGVHSLSSFTTLLAAVS